MPLTTERSQQAFHDLTLMIDNDQEALEATLKRCQHFVDLIDYTSTLNEQVISLLYLALELQPFFNDVHLYLGCNSEQRLTFIQARDVLRRKLSVTERGQVWYELARHYLGKAEEQRKRTPPPSPSVGDMYAFE